MTTATTTTRRKRAWALPLLLLLLMLFSFVSFVKEVRDTLASSLLSYRASVFLSLSLSSSSSSSSSLSSSASSSASSSSSPYAYAFLIAGCNPSDEHKHQTGHYGTYSGYIYHVMASAFLLRHLANSTADVVLLVRMAANLSPHVNTLPQEESRVLQALGVEIIYLPRATTDDFVSAVFDKFQILNLVHYERILFLDSDVLPLCNMDYLFHHSHHPDGLLQENVVFGTHNEPSNAGFFLLTPQEQGFDKIMSVVDSKYREFGAEWNETIGWGQEMVEGWQPWDYHDDQTPRQYKWDFYCSDLDQGLLWHWVKYVKDSVSVILKPNILTFFRYSVNDDKIVTSQLQDTIPWSNLLGNQSSSSSSSSSSSRRHHQQHQQQQHPHCPAMGVYRTAKYNRLSTGDFFHFTGGDKPWLKEFRPQYKDISTNRLHEMTDPKELWYHLLQRVNQEYQMGLNISRLSTDNLQPPLGLFPGKAMVKQWYENRYSNKDA